MASAVTHARRPTPVRRGGALLIAATLAAPALARQAHEQDLPPAEHVLDRHVQATGGAPAHRALKTRKRTGRLEISMAGHELEARTEEHFQAPDKSHVVIDGDLVSQVTACNGALAWEWRPDQHGEGEGTTRLLEGDALAQAVEKAAFDAALDWRQRFAEVRTVGRSDVEGRPAYEVRVKTKDGEQYSQFYDVENGRLVKRTRALKRGQMGELQTQAFFGDYREIDGVWLPMRVHTLLESSTMGKGTQTWTYTTIEHGVKIPGSLFEVPEELRAAAEAASGGGHGGGR